MNLQRLRAFEFQLSAAGLVFCLAIGFAGRAKADLVDTNVYTNYTDNQSTTVAFAGSPAASLSTPDLDQFGAAVGWNWRPIGAVPFAADSLAHINVTTPETFTFILAGTQDSYLYIDGAFAVAHGSLFVGQGQTTVPLSTGIHLVEVQYAIVNPPGSESGFEVTISPSSGYSFTALPEPTAITLFAVGMCGLLIRRRAGFARK